MSNDEKCRLIAEFEGYQFTTEGTWLLPDRSARTWILSDYHRDLNATMRAARRLPEDTTLVVEMSHRGGEAWIYEMIIEGDHHTGDPAQAACDALAEWIAAHPNDQG